MKRIALEPLETAPAESVVFPFLAMLDEMQGETIARCCTIDRFMLALVSKGMRAHLTSIWRRTQKTQPIFAVAQWKEKMCHRLGKRGDMKLLDFFVQGDRNHLNWILTPAATLRCFEAACAASQWALAKLFRPTDAGLCYRDTLLVPFVDEDRTHAVLRALSKGIGMSTELAEVWRLYLANLDTLQAFEFYYKLGERSLPDMLLLDRLKYFGALDVSDQARVQRVLAAVAMCGRVALFRHLMDDAPFEMLKRILWAGHPECDRGCLMCHVESFLWLALDYSRSGLRTLSVTANGIDLDKLRRAKFTQECMMCMLFNDEALPVFEAFDFFVDEVHMPVATLVERASYVVKKHRLSKPTPETMAQWLKHREECARTFY